MATIDPVRSSPQYNIEQILWETIEEGDDGAPIEPQGAAGGMMSFQAVGTFGSTTITLQGSNDGTNYVTLKDINGTDISLTAAGLVDVSTAARYVRPLSTGGTSTDVDCYLIMRSLPNGL